MNSVSLTHWLQICEPACQPSSSFLIIMCGLSGSGKSTVSQFLAEHYRAAWIRSDIERKRLFGLAPDQSSHGLQSSHGIEEDIYSQKATQAVFERMNTLTQQLLLEKYPVIVDSCALKADERLQFNQTAKKTGSTGITIPCITIHCLARMKTMAERINVRQHQGTDPSEASVEILSMQQQWFEEPSERHTPHLIRLNTEHNQWQSVLLAALEDLQIS